MKWSAPLIALVVVLGSILVMAVGGTVVFITRTLPPYTAARDFLDDVAHNRDASAAARLCGADNAASTMQGVRDRLGSNVKTISPNPLGVDRSGNTATVDFSVSYSDGSSARNFSIPVVDESGHWKACP